MLLDNENFSHIDEFQIIQEENLPGRLNNMKKYENFDEILLASFRSYGNFDEILSASLRSCENFISTSLRSYDEPEEEPEVERIREFLNKAYTDLMTLVIENNLSNKVRNAIIKFFNKHSDLLQLLPLPKILNPDEKYFIHYHFIKNCIENLLSNPETLKHFMFKYENSEEKKSYGEQNSENW
ncbi:hypothetical protein Glove_307g9 [Diversispora epigaea]|uniref:Uncharacterized protein n=1 Tax=Diversispora epigaea TaxID=1348612 RepID=A0A397HY27_9GLOM|nr:hypothetical protein Glove_307g9 [Diversispora epigaea]